MKFSHRQDILAPIEFVFDVVADFDSHERQALRRGIDISRNDDLSVIAQGISWKADVPYRGKLRKVSGHLSQFDQPDGYRIQSVSGGLKINFELELVALAKGRTRMKTGLDLRPDTMKARLLVQSLKLAKARLDRRFRHRISNYALEIEASFAGPDAMIDRV